SERALKKRAHWQAIACSACEQCGRNRVPQIDEVREFDAFLAASQGERVVLSLAAGSQVMQGLASGEALTVLVGPEGGLSPEEDRQARAAGFAAVGLGERVLRAETAALAALVLAT